MKPQISQIREGGHRVSVIDFFVPDGFLRRFRPSSFASVICEICGLSLIFGSAGILMLCLTMAAATAQNPPETGDPYASRGNPKSPDGKYEWTVRITNPIRYELVKVPDGRVVVTVNAYYPEANSSNIQYAKAYGIFWNKDGTVVALDELNRRRAGHLYFFILRNGIAHEIRSEDIFQIPLYADEGRVVVDPGWVSGTKIRVRQALKTRSGEFVSKYFIVDFANPDDPRIQPE